MVTNEERIQANNAELQEAIAMAQSLPDAGSASDAVLYTEQTLTDEQKAQARANIGAAAIEESGNVGSSFVNLLIEILQNAIYENDQSANIEALRDALGSDNGDSGDNSIPLTVIHGNVARNDGSSIVYDTTSSTATSKERAATNPFAFYCETGKAYKFTIGNSTIYQMFVGGFTSSQTGVDFVVVEGTKKEFKGDYTRVHTSGWSAADYAVTPDGTYQLFNVTFRRTDGGAFSDDDIAALNEVFKVTVQ